MDHVMRAGTPRRELLKGAAGIAAGAAAATMLTGGSPVSAAGGRTSMSMSIDNLGEFAVLSFSWGASQSGSFHVGGGGGAGKASFQDLSFTKFTDTLSPELVELLATGGHLDRATLTVVQQGGVLQRYTLQQVLVTSISLGGSTGSDAFTENVTLNFAGFEFEVDQASFGWNIAANAPG